MFNSFFMGGFECADHINRSGLRVDLLKSTQHDIRVEEDYLLLAEIRITTVREGICWSNVEKVPYQYDFTEVLNRIKIAEQLGIQQIWDLIHFGYPDDLSPTHPQFCDRFEKLCFAFASFYNENSSSELFVVPINEISFLSWHSGEVRGTVPFMVNSGWDIKYHLCKAAIIGIRALKLASRSCTIILVEPLIEVHYEETFTSEEVQMGQSYQFQAMDIILGKICPELGGANDMADLLGFNYYWNCQWEFNGPTLPWPETEFKRTPLAYLLNVAHERYQKKMLITETGHFGSGRVQWINEIVVDVLLAKAMGVPLLGVCIYPVTDRPDWDDLTSYSNCGIWDLDDFHNRIPDEEYIKAIKIAIEQLNFKYDYGKKYS